MVLPFFPLNMYWENEKGKAHVHTRARHQASGQKQKEWDTFEQKISFTIWWDVWYHPEKTVLFICKYMQRQQILSFQKKQSPKGNKIFEWRQITIRNGYKSSLSCSKREKIQKSLCFFLCLLVRPLPSTVSEPEGVMELVSVLLLLPFSPFLLRFPSFLSVFLFVLSFSPRFFIYNNVLSTGVLLLFSAHAPSLCLRWFPPPQDLPCASTRAVHTPPPLPLQLVPCVGSLSSPEHQ